MTRRPALRSGGLRGGFPASLRPPAAAGGGSPTSWSVFGSAAFPDALSATNDGQPITLVSAFYSTTAGRQLVGARLYLPPGTSFGATVPFRVWTDLEPDLSTAPAATVTAAAGDGWVEALLAAPIAMPTSLPVWVGFYSTSGDYVHAPGPAPAVESADLPGLYLASASDNYGSGYSDRSRFRYDDGTYGTSQLEFAIDVLVA